MVISRFLLDNFIRIFFILLLYRLQLYLIFISFTWELLGYCLGQWVCCLQNSFIFGLLLEDFGQNLLNCLLLWLFLFFLGFCYILIFFLFWQDFYWGCCVFWDCCFILVLRDIKFCVGSQWQLFLFYWLLLFFLLCFMFFIGFNFWRIVSFVSLLIVIFILKICVSYSISFGIFFNVRFLYLRI